LEDFENQPACSAQKNNVTALKEQEAITYSSRRKGPPDKKLGGLPFVCHTLKTRRRLFATSHPEVG